MSDQRSYRNATRRAIEVRVGFASVIVPPRGTVTAPPDAPHLAALVQRGDFTIVPTSPEATTPRSRKPASRKTGSGSRSRRGTGGPTRARSATARAEAAPGKAPSGPKDQRDGDSA